MRETGNGQIPAQLALPKKRRWLRWGAHWIAILVVLLFFAVPVVWLLSVSFKPPQEWQAFPPTLIPQEPTLDNYLLLANPELPKGSASYMLRVTEPVTKSFLNSFIIVPIATFISAVVGFLAAYGVSRYRVGGDFMPFFVLTTRMFPPVAFAVPLLVYYQNLRLIDTRLGMVLIYAGFTVAFSLWMMKGFIDAVPRSVEEAAILDGASRWRVLFTITLPLVKGGLAATGLFVFILNWTEFLYALIFTSTRSITVPVQLSHYVGAVGRFYGPQAALGVVASIPAVILGYLIQRHLVTGFSFGLIRK
ncbi:MAG: ABC transporter permease subunit [Proteobacteria bacterium]|nr:ABC transporter permease subunit [Pseudomonadota bacterium]